MDKKTCIIKGCTKQAASFSRCWNCYREWQANAQKRYKDKRQAEAKNKPVQERLASLGISGRKKIDSSSTPTKKHKTRIPTKTKKHAKSRERYREVILELAKKWEEAGENNCWECGKFVKLLQYGEKVEVNFTAFAHIVGRGECGGKEAVVNDPENLACMCAECHTKMDQGGGSTDRGNIRWQGMKCRHSLMINWHYIRQKHKLK